MMLFRTIIFYSILFLMPQFTLAMDCSSSMQEYVIRGDLNSNYVGARLWRLSKLKRNAKANKTCAKELFEQAVKESSDYWNHIDKKYGCHVTNSDAPEEQSCSDSINDKIISNQAYLSLITAESQFSKKDSDKAESDLGLQKKNLSDLASLMAETTKPDDKCNAVPLKDRINLESGSSPESDLAEATIKGTGSCIWGLLSGFFKEGIYASLKEIWSLLADPESVVMAMMDIGKELIKDPARTMAQISKNLLDSVYSAFFKKYENFDCFNSEKKSEVMCSTLGQSAAFVVEAILGAKVFSGGSQIFKKLAKKKSNALEGELLPETKRLTGPKVKREGETIDGELVTEPKKARSPKTRPRLENKEDRRLIKVESAESSASETKIPDQPNHNSAAEAKAEPKPEPNVNSEPKVKESSGNQKIAETDITGLIKHYEKWGSISDKNLAKYLGLAPEADEKEITKQLRLLLKKYHSDLNHDKETQKYFNTIMQLHKKRAKEIKAGKNASP